MLGPQYHIQKLSISSIDFHVLSLIIVDCKGTELFISVIICYLSFTVVSVTEGVSPSNTGHFPPISIFLFSTFIFVMNTLIS